MNIVKLKFLAIGLLGALLLACTDPVTLQSIEGYAQGTTYHISFWSTNPVDHAVLSETVSGELAAIDASMSGYREDSTIERFNKQHANAPVLVDPEIVSLVKQARAVNELSGGCYDLTVKPLFDLWGFTDDHFAVPDADAIASLLRTIGMDKLKVIDESRLRKTDPALQVDLSSIAQGYSVGRIAQVLEHHDIHNFLAEIGGELMVKGSKPDGQSWRVAIEKPLPGERSIEKVITLEKGGPMTITTSGTYRHFYDEQGVRYSHILDARTGYPVTHETVSVTVLYPDAALADAWATALLCLGRESGIKMADEQGIPALFIEQSGDELRETVSRPLRQMSGVRIE